MERLYIDGNNARFRRRGLTTVDMELCDGRILENLEPRRLFPISGQTRYITLLDDDLNERAVIRNLDTLTEEGKTIICDCLKEYYMIPKISRIYDIDDRVSKIRFDVETDRGRQTIEITNIVHQIKLMQNVRVLFRDSNDNRYEIPDITRLDAKSQKPLDFYL